MSSTRILWISCLDWRIPTIFSIFLLLLVLLGIGFIRYWRKVICLDDKYRKDARLWFISSVYRAASYRASVTASIALTSVITSHVSNKKWLNWKKFSSSTRNLIQKRALASNRRKLDIHLTSSLLFQATIFVGVVIDVFKVQNFILKTVLLLALALLNCKLENQAKGVVVGALVLRTRSH